MAALCGSDLEECFVSLFVVVVDRGFDLCWVVGYVSGWFVIVIVLFVGRGVGWLRKKEMDWLLFSSCGWVTFLLSGWRS